MLALAQMRVPVSVDVKRLWADVRQTFPGVEGSNLINRLRGAVVARARHADGMAEALAYAIRTRDK
jgi:hypothetical protein